MILNDIHPEEQPGAASIAFNFAKELALKHKIEYWYSQGKFKPNLNIENFALKPFRRFRFVPLQLQNYAIIKRYREFFSLYLSFMFACRLLKLKPDLIWIHQLGNQLPRSLIIVIKILKIQNIQTLHDFSLVLPGKLYPEDLEVKKSNMEMHNFRSRKIHKRYIARRFLAIKLTNMNSKTICLSELQKNILDTFGVRVDFVLPNGVPRIGSVDIPIIVDDKKFNVVFVGRSIGKGLEKICEAVMQSKNAFLHLVGSEDLLNIAHEKLDQNRFKFHGRLSEPEVRNLIRQVDITSVLSECFDVYPTITIESLIEGTPVITTQTTGNASLVSEISSELIIPLKMIPNLDEIALIILEKEFQAKLKKAQLISVDLTESVRNYQDCYLLNSF